MIATCSPRLSASTPGDRHYNVSDFPDEQLEPLGIVAQHPDTFLLHLLELAPVAVVQVLHEQIAAMTNPPESLHGLLGRTP